MDYQDDVRIPEFKELPVQTYLHLYPEKRSCL